MINAYNYFFFRVYDWQNRWWASSADPRLIASLAVSLLLYINLLSLYRIVPYVAGITVRIDAVYLLLAAVILGGINALYIFRSDRVQRIHERFGSETERDRRLNLAWCWYYVAASKIVFITSVQTLPLM
ncbi:MAG: hypothetical protein QUS14_09200 [Pyrinomonadaceae bacterium]|nr:hypothetical protein [Pyrinomonadaceae bacterium]